MSEQPTLTLSFPEPKIAVLTFDDPVKSANILSQKVLGELSAHLDALEKRSDLSGLILASAKPGMFIAGADLREFAASLDQTPAKTVELCHKGRRLFQRLCQLPFVTVSAIDGICVGGGAEMACWCDHRVMTNSPKSQIGFPEVKLGLYPGWGGTARTTRIVGLSNAIELVTGGESIDGRAAAAMGLAWDAVAPDNLLESAKNLVRYEAQAKEYLCLREQYNSGIQVSDTELTFLGATASAYITGQTKGQYPAPLAALEMMLEAAGLDIEAACTKEAEGMAALFGSPINRSLINVFFLSDRNKKDAGVGDAEVSAAGTTRVSVVGAGIMGLGIAAATVKRQTAAVLADISRDALAKGVKSVLEEVSYDKTTKKPDAKKMSDLAPFLIPTSSDAEIASSDIVIEAVVENADVKKQLYKRLESLMSDQGILASNTSTIPIARLAEGLRRPDKFCGIHFFNPVRKMPLVEVIRGPATSDETTARAVAFAKQIGKSPIVVNDGPGFVVNRLLLPYMNESLELIMEGVPVKDVERAAKQFGMPMGPITLNDVVGLDTALYAGKVMYDAFPDRINPSPLLGALVKNGRLGQKTGAGFFKYAKGQDKGVPDPDFDAILARYVTTPKKLDQETITNRMFLPMLLEATRVMSEGIARDVRDVDLALIYGIGFPPFRGGLFFWADTLGAKKIVELLKPFEALGPRMQPTEMLLDYAKSDRKFYGG